MCHDGGDARKFATGILPGVFGSASLTCVGRSPFRYIDAGRFVANVVGDSDGRSRFYKTQVERLLVDIHGEPRSLSDFPLQLLPLVTERFCGLALTLSDIESVYRCLQLEHSKTNASVEAHVEPIVNIQRPRLSSCVGSGMAPICDGCPGRVGAMVITSAGKYEHYTPSELCEIFVDKDVRIAALSQRVRALQTKCNRRDGRIMALQAAGTAKRRA